MEVTRVMEVMEAWVACRGIEKISGLTGSPTHRLISITSIRCLK